MTDETSTDEVRNLEGFVNSFPSFGIAAEGRDYVILGKHGDWPVKPISLTIQEKNETRAVAKEDHDFMSRGWKLEDGTFNGLVKLENNEEEQVRINIITVH
eukprot:CAMPEP_0194141090 /NCGR_PEP_ID=MMETSP0152-20130528/10576_1 /TAXON_ID=1049557 /ORGANISM="Thalassiothrix antarctica, Strain L6-D1" /LENGTH=100 /DNA_ID=CAMNT_0038839613 /DNA_START=12 /DNA_END=314 /DNA_ORIENTATION=-